MKRFAVIGNPVAHSRSPEIHQLFAAQLGLRLRYERLHAEPADFVASVERFLAEGGAGLNVTVPFKAAAAAWVTEFDSAAAAAQAVNTLVPLRGGVRGCNTDGRGLLADLQDNLGITLRDRRLVVLGAGGAAAGVLGPLLAAGPAALLLANRTMSRAQQLAARFSGVEAVAFADLAGPFDVVVNATSVGLDDSTLTFTDLLPADLVAGADCYDMLYGPKAAFGAYAQAGGARQVADGLGMLVEQAAAAFTLWHGQAPDTAPVLARLRGPADTTADPEG